MMNNPLTEAERQDIRDYLAKIPAHGWTQVRLRKLLDRLDELEPPESEQ